MQVDRKESEQGTDRFRSYGYGQGAGVPPPNIPSRADKEMSFFNKIRPQIILAIFTLGVVSVVALAMGEEQYIAVVTGCTGGIIALGMKLLDGE